MDVSEKDPKHIDENWYMQQSFQHWRSWGSWFSWGSPVGLGLFFIEIGITVWLLHLANIIH